MTRFAALLCASAAILAVACGNTTDEPTTSPSASGQGAPGATAVVEGTVRLAEGAELPRYADNPVTPVHDRIQPPESCTPPQLSDREPVQRAPSGALAGMLVALHDFETAAEHEPVTHELTITDCRLSPRLVVATRGDRLRLTNQMEYPFMPDFHQGLVQALLHRQTREVELPQGGVSSLSCAFTAPCGRAEVVTLYHPLHAITGESGTFRIEGVPAHDELRVSAWHPLFQEASETLTLEPGETRHVELVVSPAEAPAPPAEPAPGDAAEGAPEGGDILF
jgi:hypothetical protein